MKMIRSQQYTNTQKARVPEPKTKTASHPRGLRRLLHSATRTITQLIFVSLHQHYWSELATLENAPSAFDPTSRSVPTTITKITANITAYSAMS